MILRVESVENGLGNLGKKKPSPKRGLFELVNLKELE